MKAIYCSVLLLGLVIVLIVVLPKSKTYRFNLLGVCSQVKGKENAIYRGCY